MNMLLLQSMIEDNIYVSEFYKKEKFLETYKYSIESLKWDEFWEDNPLMSCCHQIFLKI